MGIQFLWAVGSVYKTKLWKNNMQLNSINPKNNQLINSWDIHSVDEVNDILEKGWAHTWNGKILDCHLKLIV